MASASETAAPILRIVGADQLQPIVRDAAIWRSLQLDYQTEEGAWDSEVWQALEAPVDPQKPPGLFLYNQDTGVAHIVPHCGYLGVAKTIGVDYLLKAS